MSQRGGSPISPVHPAAMPDTIATAGQQTKTPEKDPGLQHLFYWFKTLDEQGERADHRTGPAGRA